MFTIGKHQTLIVNRIEKQGYYLEVPGTDLDDVILLPGKQAPEDTVVGSEIEVFIYRDKLDRLIATTRKPKVTLGQLERLKVVKTESFGAFLDWGLERDLFLPFAEQTRTVAEDEKILIRLYLDKTERLCATMKTQRNLQTHPPYAIGDARSATIYRINNDLGLFVAVEDIYDGLVLQQEVMGKYTVGDVLDLYVSKINDNGQLVMSFRKAAHLQLDDDAQHILEALKRNKGYLPYNDASPAEVIRSHFGMSKKAFKRALGRLYKEKSVILLEEGISIFVDNDPENQ